MPARVNLFLYNAIAFSTPLPTSPTCEYAQLKKGDTRPFIPSPPSTGHFNNSIMLIARSPCFFSSAITLAISGYTSIQGA